ncbi:MAG TPA: citryl-CoA lyase [Roseiarcus sp.]|nr:citryl-CoA lyase [Roseiarcus sp.]
MLIGKSGEAKTAIAAAAADRVLVRGRDLAKDLIGSVSFAEFYFLLATGRDPTPDQRFFLDACLVALAEHGLTPSVQAARMTLAADPAALQGAVAAGILGCGSVILGTADLCARALDDIFRRVEAGVSLDAAATGWARERRAAGAPAPGYGHPLHKPLDPRAERLIALAQARGVAGRAVDCATRLTGIVADIWGKKLPMNVSMAIAAVLKDVDVPEALIRGLPILARTAGLIAHLAEEARTPIGFFMASRAEAAIDHSEAARGGAER